ncbi:MAG: glycosyltransferase [Candidatus Omnitrophica bacterium]|nr:glycosyltransferase [Candidatus Omnitrophota bacterium]
MNPKISVIIPVYNGEGFISDAIESVMRQEYRAHEIIVVDDGSTDETLSELDAYEGKIIRMRMRNAGVSAARNAGMRKATGDYVAFLDHDDIWFEARLRRQVDFIRQYPETGFFCCDHILDDPSVPDGKRHHFSRLKHLKEMNFDEPLKTNFFELLIKENFVGTASAVVLKKQTIQKVGFFNVRNPISQDYDYWLRCALVTSAVVMSEGLLYKRKHDHNLSGDLIGMYSDHKVVLSNLIRSHGVYLKQSELLNTAYLEIARTSYSIGNFLFDGGRKREAFKLYAETFLGFKTWRNLALFIPTVFKKTCRLLLLDRIRHA